MKDIKQDLTDRLALLDLRRNIVFGPHGGEDPLGEMMYEHLAAKLENALHDEETMKSAAERVRAIIDPAELSGTEFWKTPLGALLFAAGGFLEKEMPQSLAASLLGCSRQYVHEMIKSGKLAAPAPMQRHRMVSAEAVRELLLRKLDRFVN